jgi:hypothetical protein
MDAAPEYGHASASSEVQETVPDELGTVQLGSPESNPAFGTRLAVDGCEQLQNAGPGQQRPPQMLEVHWLLPPQIWPLPILARQVPAALQ